MRGTTENTELTEGNLFRFLSSLFSVIPGFSSRFSFAFFAASLLCVSKGFD